MDIQQHEIRGLFICVLVRFFHLCSDTYLSNFIMEHSTSCGLFRTYVTCYQISKVFYRIPQILDVERCDGNKIKIKGVCLHNLSIL